MFVAVSDEFQVEVILVPGANRSTQGPKLEYEARVSSLPVAPTTIAAATSEGEKLQAFELAFPAATT